jgi:hypothetical protein
MSRRNGGRSRSLIKGFHLGGRIESTRDEWHER